MSKAKLFALIGNIIRTVMLVWGFITAFKILTDPSSLTSKLPASTAAALSSSQIAAVRSFTGVVSIVAQIIGLLVLVLTWIAYTKMDTEKERGWKIFLLVMGILGCFSIFTVIGNPIPSLLNFAGAVCFILAFAFKGPNSKNDEEEFIN